MIYVLRESMEVEVAAYQGGEVAERLNKNGIPVMLDVDAALSKAILGEYDYIFLNTLEMYPAMKELKDESVAVYWWIHESIEVFAEYIDVITDRFLQD